jgi:hypothetical protein
VAASRATGARQRALAVLIRPARSGDSLAVALPSC